MLTTLFRNGRLEAQCFDGTRRLGNIRGKLRKKVWINQGDIILLSLRDYQDDKGDVMYVATSRKSQSPPPPPSPPSRNTTQADRCELSCSLKYTADEARSLKAYGELPETAKINETDNFGGGEDGDCGFEFDEDRDSESGDEGGAGGKEVDIDDI